MGFMEKFCNIDCNDFCVLCLVLCSITSNKKNEIIVEQSISDSLYIRILIFALISLLNMWVSVCSGNANSFGDIAGLSVLLEYELRIN